MEGVGVSRRGGALSSHAADPLVHPLHHACITGEFKFSVWNADSTIHGVEYHIQCVAARVASTLLPFYRFMA